MSVLSNVELQELLQGSSPIVQKIDGAIEADATNSAVEPASIRLTVGKIFQLQRDEDNKNALVEQQNSTIIKEGGVVLVLTKELINFDARHTGFTTAKSGGMAERGILITNTGHVDPGYRGCLRYVVINMGHEPFSLRVGDVIARLTIFRLSTPANPDWSKTHNVIPDPTVTSVRPLGYDFLNIERRAEQIAERKAKEVTYDALMSIGMPALIIGIVVSVVLGVFGGIVTLGVGKWL